ncbi:MAG: hypothetical protein ACTSV1_06070 [Alphaproteobacteria bacterium]
MVMVCRSPEGHLRTRTVYLGRALFYVRVIPTTMPGGFFWKNKGFEEHARVTGLAGREQTGMAPASH